MTDAEIAQAIAYCRVLWPHSRVADTEQATVILAWRGLVADLELRHVRAAIDKLAAEGREHAPPPGVIRRIATRFREDSQTGDLPSADEAWAEVLREISRVGYTIELTGEELQFKHPVIQAAVDALGWGYICRSTDHMADRAHFIRFYETACQRLAFEQAMPPSVRGLISPESLPAELPVEAETA